MSKICIIGAGPAGLGLALGLARRGTAGEVVVYDRAENHKTAPRYNPDRSYTIDITGHGVRALEYLGVSSRFDKELIKFKGIKVLPLHKVEPWDGPGWTGSRGDICRTLMSECEEKFPGKVNFVFDSEVEILDVYTGKVAIKGKSGDITKKTFDFVAASDGAGSLARSQALSSVPGFEIEKSQVNNYCTMIHFDKATNELDPEWLYGFSVSPFVVGGAINGDNGPKDPKWFCMLGFDRKKKFTDAQEAKQCIQRCCPKILKYVSEKEIEAFSKRECSHIGRAAVCNKFNAGRVVIIGNAGNPFPPVGQGINAALESAMVLDQCLVEAEGAGGEGKGFCWAGDRFTEKWLSEAHGINWIAQRLEFGNTWKMGLVVTAALLGFSVLTDAKKSTMKWSEVARAAKGRQKLLFKSGYALLGAAALGAAFLGGYKLGHFMWGSK
uniref:FAD-binding domain-containing protein n=1 Tax=Chromera velia CCMP2878 TaxID=1169474 RepID=A0A0G4F5P6_9ALVE|eukprot:Cvel_15249.t1-p1 / transcript=Cvel_15249.t1 / gene=Cvel_15249 / organism=Chromera_velia_CCMP2878 / gene_product=hypothetical protein / transcript_product=hypothetical protein / location=Cvel_scaffold1117:876-2189(+) / protein_length=438 / sequence_SO=supercontig / SO=protein_coding / is_pseudo=false